MWFVKYFSILFHLYSFEKWVEWNPLTHFGVPKGMLKAAIKKYRQNESLLGAFDYWFWALILNFVFVMDVFEFLDAWLDKREFFRNFAW